VKITGQLKLLTHWIRGNNIENDPMNGKHLVPLSILRSMQRTIPAALRPYDEDRIKKADEATKNDR